MKFQCESCWRQFDQHAIAKVNGSPICDKCAAKRLKYAFGRRE
jgi:formylmethanofuran dehydrogenase subunit E